MKTFNEWLHEYTKEHGTPPAHVMAEAAWYYAYMKGFMRGKAYTGDSDLTVKEKT